MSKLLSSRNLFGCMDKCNFSTHLSKLSCSVLSQHCFIFSFYVPLRRFHLVRHVVTVFWRTNHLGPVCLLFILILLSSLQKCNYLKTHGAFYWLFLLVFIHTTFKKTFNVDKNWHRLLESSLNSIKWRLMWNRLLKHVTSSILLSNLHLYNNIYDIRHVGLESKIIRNADCTLAHCQIVSLHIFNIYLALDQILANGSECTR